MRGALGRRIANPNFSILPSSYYTFSTSSSGRGRGGADPTFFSSRRVPGQLARSDDSGTTDSAGGYGRGKPVSSFMPFLSTVVAHQSPPSGRGGSGENHNASIFSLLSPSGAGRGKTDAKLPGPPQQQVQEDNRHIRSPRPANAASDTPKMSTEDAVNKAMGILARGDGIGSGTGGGRDMSDRGRFDKDEEDKLYLGDDADAEKLAKAIGPKKMSQLTNAFEEINLPSPDMDHYIHALDTNLAIECEPEYLFAESGRNPDIDEATSISLREELEKMKPLLMAYEGIQSQEDWEKAMNEVMDRVPLLKEIVDHYSGPDRVTAKRQKEELEKIARSLPECAPASVQKFTSRALLSLQSNPGWGFYKKRQIIDKLAREVNHLNGCLNS